MYDGITFRNYSTLIPTEYIAEFSTPNNLGYVENWVVRLIFEDGDYNPDMPCVEFYSADTNQFVSSYYADTFLGYDEWGGGYGNGLDLWGDIASWKITAADADAIREWVENICVNELDVVFE